jgi:hypothetical protein
MTLVDQAQRVRIREFRVVAWLVIILYTFALLGLLVAYYDNDSVKNGRFLLRNGPGELEAEIRGWAHYMADYMGKLLVGLPKEVVRDFPQSESEWTEKAWRDVMAYLRTRYWLYVVLWMAPIPAFAIGFLVGLKTVTRLGSPEREVIRI